MDRLVHQYSATIQLPGPAPCSTVVVRLGTPPGYQGVAEYQSAKSLRLNQIMELDGVRIEAMLADDGQLHTSLLLHPQHLCNRRTSDLQRFLNDHIHASAHDLSSVFPMLTTGCDNIEVLTCQHLLKIPIVLHVKFLH